ncbi:hypothetical protein [Vreelandella lionensis]|uniref:hypothetical protein n=1 Tax=Vreelandella lionensis TaxID=1144478 RepID=UPI001FB24545|nr:hypothetical protein [Halomonas lionensis]
MSLSLNGVTLASVRERDQQDPLAHFKQRFALPEGVLYLDGNSLGAQPMAAKQAVTNTLDQMARRVNQRLEPGLVRCTRAPGQPIGSDYWRQARRSERYRQYHFEYL